MHTPQLPECLDSEIISDWSRTLRRAEWKEATDGLDPTFCDSLLLSEMVRGKNEYLQSTQEESVVNESESECQELRRGRQSKLYTRKPCYRKDDTVMR